MKTEMGEYIVGAYLKLVEGCDVVDYNVRPPGGGVAGLAEFDVIGLRFSDSTAFMCEVTTHIRGLQYGGNSESIERIKKKHVGQQKRKAWGDQAWGDGLNFFSFFAVEDVQSALRRNLHRLGMGLKHAFR